MDTPTPLPTAAGRRLIPWRWRTVAAPAPRRAPTPGPCANCGDSTPGSYCPSCGQARRETLISLREMLVDFVDDQLSLNSRLPRTAALLLLRPGFLTQEYLRGRIARYIRPLRLYLGASVLFFLLLSVLDSGWARSDLPDTVPLAAQGGAAGSAPKHWVDQVTVRTSSPALQRIVEEKKAHFRKMTPGEAFREVMLGIRERVPTTIFFLLPAFAFLLKLLYARRGRLYVEHFVFALHVHAFVFSLYSIMLVVRHEAITSVLQLWMLLYLFLAMRKVYGQPVLRTAAKCLVLGVGYSVLLGLGFVATAVVTVLLL